MFMVAPMNRDKKDSKCRLCAAFRILLWVEFGIHNQQPAVTEAVDDVRVGQTEAISPFESW